MRPPMMPFSALWLRTCALLVVAAFGLSSCSSTKAARKYTKDEASKALEKFEQTGLIIGEFSVDGANAVLDGDTIKVKGMDNSMRLLGIDTEEIFHNDHEKKFYEQRSWEQYLKDMRGGGSRPVKMATPVGEGAKNWAKALFEGVTKVRLERDHPGEIRDYYGRYLAYVFLEKNGKWINYNLECVRAGWSPYFAKYGRSRRYHEQMLEAQKTAFEGKLHIWSDAEKHYPDYGERLTWWDARGDQVARFEKEAGENPKYVPLTRWDALYRLEKMTGQEVTLLGAVSKVELGDKGPSKVKLSRTRGSDFNVIFYDKDVLLASGVIKARGEFIQVRGMVTKYLDKRRGVEQLQIVVSLPGQVIIPSTVADVPEPPLVASDVEASEESTGEDVTGEVRTVKDVQPGVTAEGVSEEAPKKKKRKAPADPAEDAFNEAD